MALALPDPLQALPVLASLIGQLRALQADLHPKGLSASCLCYALADASTKRLKTSRFPSKLASQGKSSRSRRVQPSWPSPRRSLPKRKSGTVLLSLGRKDACAERVRHVRYAFTPDLSFASLQLMALASARVQAWPGSRGGWGGPPGPGNRPQLKLQYRDFKVILTAHKRRFSASKHQSIQFEQQAEAMRAGACDESPQTRVRNGVRV